MKALRVFKKKKVRETWRGNAEGKRGEENGRRNLVVEKKRGKEKKVKICVM